MNRDKHFAIVIAGIALVIALSVATVAIAQNQIQQRECHAAGCVMWQDCDRLPGCPLHVPVQGQGAACTCC